MKKNREERLFMTIFSSSIPSPSLFNGKGKFFLILKIATYLIPLYFFFPSNPSRQYFSCIKSFIISFNFIIAISKFSINYHNKIYLEFFFCWKIHCYARGSHRPSMFFHKKYSLLHSRFFAK